MGACRAHPRGVCCCTLSLSWDISSVPPRPTFGWVLGPHEPGMAWCSSPGLLARDQGQPSPFPLSTPAPFPGKPSPTFRCAKEGGA